MRQFTVLLSLATLVVIPLASNAAEPLAAWRDTPARKRIVEFVAEVTQPGGAGYVTPADRIAVFDDDGTLWPEKPRMQGMFALQRLREMAGDHPQWRQAMPFKAALELGSKYFQEADDAAVFQLVATAHAGQTQDAFRQSAREFYATARHPRFGRPYARLGYEPMRELLAYLRVNGFRVFIVSAGSAELVRALAEDMYGIPADDVIGSTVVTTLRDEDGSLAIRRLARAHTLVDGPRKPLAIDLHIGKRPILAVGKVRSGGDIDMLRYSEQAGVPNLQILIQHDDFEREFAYDEPDKASITAANASGWLVVSMRYDWLQVFSAD